MERVAGRGVYLHSYFEIDLGLSRSDEQHSLRVGRIGGVKDCSEGGQAFAGYLVMGVFLNVSWHMTQTALAHTHYFYPWVRSDGSSL